MKDWLRFLLIAAVGAFLFGAITAHSQTKPAKNAITTPKAISANWHVAPDLAERVAKFKQVNISFNGAGLSANERKMVAKLVDASALLDDAFWRQSDPEGLKLYLQVEKSTNPQDILLRRYLRINGSRFDLIGHRDSPLSLNSRVKLPLGLFCCLLTLDLNLLRLIGDHLRRILYSFLAHHAVLSATFDWDSLAGADAFRVGRGDGVFERQTVDRG